MIIYLFLPNLFAMDPPDMAPSRPPTIAPLTAKLNQNLAFESSRLVPYRDFWWKAHKKIQLASFVFDWLWGFLKLFSHLKRLLDKVLDESLRGVDDTNPETVLEHAQNGRKNGQIECPGGSSHPLRVLYHNLRWHTALPSFKTYSKKSFALHTCILWFSLMLCWTFEQQTIYRTSSCNVAI